MLRSQLLPALLAGLLVPAIAVADDPKTPQEKLEEQHKQLDEKLTRLLNEIASVKGRLEAIEKKSGDAAETNLVLSDLREEINKLRREIRTAQKPSQEFSKMPDGGRTEVQRPPTGLFRIVNEFGTTVQVEVNRTVYYVDPGTLDIPVTAGAFTYQVLGYNTAPVSQSVGADKMREIRIHPR